MYVYIVISGCKVKAVCSTMELAQLEAGLDGEVETHEVLVENPFDEDEDAPEYLVPERVLREMGLWEFDERSKE